MRYYFLFIFFGLMMASCSSGSDESNTNQTDFPGKTHILAEIDSNCNPKQMFLFKNYKEINGTPINNNITNQEMYNLKFEIDKYTSRPLVSFVYMGHNHFVDTTDFDSHSAARYTHWQKGQIIQHISYTMQFVKKANGWVVKQPINPDGDLYPKRAFGL